MHYYPASCCEEEKPLASTAETEVQTIGNLLPDEDDLFAGVFNGLEFCADPKRGDNSEDFDLFRSVGGMELEHDDASTVANRDIGYVGGVSHFCGSPKGLLDGTDKLGTSWKRCSNPCLLQDFCGSEKAGVGLPKSTNDISPSQFGCISNGSMKVLHPVNNVLSERRSCVLDSFPSSLNVSSAGDQFGIHTPGPSLDLVKFGPTYTSSSEPFWVPDCQNNINFCIPYEPGNTGAKMLVPRASNMKNGMHTGVASPNRQQLNSRRGIIASFDNVNCPVDGHTWSNSYLLHQNSLSNKVWPNSPLHSSVISPSSPPQISGFSAFCSGSLGSMDPLSSFPLHLIKRGSPSFFQFSRNCKKPSNDVMNFSPQMAQSIGSPRECWRNLSCRRNQGSYVHADKREFELDLERILRGEDSRTTLMLKNIPNKYSSKLLLAAIDEQCKGTYDFIYLPIDFKNNCNVGYAFINMVDPRQIVPFYKSFNGKKWEKFNSEKVAALAYARIQGKAALIAHFQNSSLMNEDKRCRPILFCTNGPKAGEQEPFPMGTSARIRASKARGSFKMENQARNHGSPSTSPNSVESNRGSFSPKSVIAQEA